MRQVLTAVEDGHNYRQSIVEQTRLHIGQVKSALHNLAFIGALTVGKDDCGRAIYLIPGRFVSGVAPNLRGIRSIFDVR